MEATISSGAATSYQNRTGDEVTKTLGNIIQIQNAEVVATHLGPRPLRITLLVSSFKVIGSDTSGQFGSPRTFEGTSEYSRLLEALSTYRTPDTTASHSQNAGQSELTSADPRSRSPLSASENCYGSQQLFSQIPAPSGSSNRATQAEEKLMLDAQPSTAQMSNTARELSRNSNPVDQKAKLLELLKAQNTSKPLPEKAIRLPEQAKKTRPLLENVIEAQHIVLPTKAEPSSTVQPEPEQSLKSSLTQVSGYEHRKLNPSQSRAKKIRSRDIKISHEQRKLLDREHSWLPAEPGHRGPVANVPMAVLQEVTEKVEQRAAEKSRQELEVLEQSRRQSEELTRNDEADHRRDQQSESPVPSVDWPPSSPIQARNELPPDSSTEIAGGSDDEDKANPKRSDTSAAEEDTSRSRQISPFSRRESTTSLVQNTDPRLEVVAPLSSQPKSGRSKDDAELASTALTRKTTSSAMQPSSSIQIESIAAIGQEALENDSDIEMSVPIGLHDDEVTRTDRSITSEVPSTAFESLEPFTQVKRTPNANGRDHRNMAQVEQQSSAPEILSSPSKRRRIDSLGRAQKVSFNSSDENMQGLSPKSTYYPMSLPSTAAPFQTRTSSVEETIFDNSAQQEVLHSISSATDGASNTNSPVRDLAQVSDPTGNVTSSVVDQPNDRISNLRREPESPILSPFVSKRRKVRRSPATFKFTQEEYPKEDPSITAKRYRQEFFASRKNSRSKSYVSFCEVGSGNTPGSADGKSGGFAAAQEYPAATEESQGAPSAPFDSHDHPQGFCSSPIQDGSNTRTESPTHEKIVGLIDERLDESSYGASTPPEIDSKVTLPAVIPTYQASGQAPVTASVEQPSLLLAQSIQSDLHSVSTKLEGLSSTDVSQRTDRSGQAQPLPELMTPALSVAEIPQRVSPAVKDLTQAEEHPPLLGIFPRFKATYPDYLGTEEHFVNMCKKIHHLVRADRMEHKSLWDDFIIRHKTDYQQYCQQCMDNAEDPKPYERFYQEEVDGPKYNKRIVLPTTLGEMIPAEQAPPNGQGPHQTTTSTRPGSPTVRIGAQFTTSSGHPQGSIPIRKPLKESTKSILTRSMPSLETLSNTSEQISVERGGRESPERSTQLDKPDFLDSKEPIDLTSDQSSSPTPAPHSRLSKIVSKRVGERSLRKIPWQEHTSASDPSGNQSRQEQNHLRGSSIARTLNMQLTDNKYPTARRPALDEFPMPRSKDSSRKGQTPTASAPSKKSRPKPQAAAVDEWWKDDNTPFREYVKLYQSITPGKGNAWAKEKGTPRATASAEEDKQAGSGREESPELGSMDIMKWRL